MILSQHDSASAKGLELFWGRSSPALANLYVRYHTPDPAGVRIVGRIEGPDCAQAATLRAQFPLRFLGADPQPLAQTTVTEPCFWTPRTPYVYRAQVEVWRGDELIVGSDQLCAARPLGTVGRNLVLAAKRWVLRGVQRDSIAPEEVHDWIAAAAVACVPAPSDEVCRLATLGGLGIAAYVEGEAHALQSELARLARWPAVMAALLPEDVLLDESWRPPPGLLLIQCMGRERTWRRRPWAQAIVAPFEDPTELAASAHATGCPVIAQRPSWASDLPAARLECDRLQRDLAASGDFAGYLV